MLQGIHRLGQSWVGKAIMAVMFGFLIVSFAIWGIGDIFRGGVRTQVATVGRAEISAEAFRNAYQTDLQRLMRQTRQSISPERARALGIDARVLGRLVSEAALDQRARDLGLSVSDQLVAQTIASDPAFRGAGGQFDRNLFNDLLRSNGLNEAGFVREQRQVVTRMQLAEAVTGRLSVPLAMREAVHRYANERRAAAYATLTAAALGEIPAPTDQQLATYFAERKAEFRAPEFRSFNALALDPAALAKPEAVSDEEARARYEQGKATLYGTPEKRALQQIVFASRSEAEAAFQRIKDGATFEAIATERGIDPKNLDLGTYARSEMIDPPVAEAAFSLAEGAVSGPVDGRFGPALVRVTRIEPESVKPYEQVMGEVKAQVAIEKARKEIESVHDQIDDMRASARPLADIARDKNLKLVSVPAMDRSGKDKAGQAVADLPDRDALIAAVFASDIGVDNEALRTREGGYVWFDVTGIQPARERTLDEAREAVTAQWRSDEIARRLGEKAAAMVERLQKGDAIEAVAAEAGLTATTASDLARNANAGDLTQPVVARIFATPVGQAASAAPRDDARVVFKVTGATMPPFASSTQQAGAVEEQLAAALGDDMLAQFIAQIEKEVGVTLHQQNLRRVVGGEF
jgi:peptidyl-prolyl cis-trans isomerase D